MLRHVKFCLGLAVVLGCCVICRAENKGGAIALEESKLGPPEGALKIEMGSAIKLVARPHIAQMFGEKIIIGEATVQNTTKEPLFYVFSLAFYDKDNNLIGCVSNRAFEAVRPGETEPLASCMVFLPAEELAKVVSYQATFFEAEKSFAGK